jgi:dihydroflavonol-4-reductase
MRVLVTGATGFLGRHLVAALVARGDDVVILARSTIRLPGGSAVTVRQGDILDADSVRAAAEGCDGVYHCAGRVSRDPDDALLLWRTHVEGTRTVLTAARDAGARRAVVASTSGIVGMSEDPAHVAREDDATPYKLIQRFPYYRSKLYAEQEALRLNAEGFSVVAVNPSLLLGPGDVYGSSTGDVKKFLDGKVPAIPGGGLSYVDARDAAEGMILAMEKGAGGRRYLLGASNCTLRAFFGRLERVSGVRAPTLVLPRSRAVARIGVGLLERAMKLVGAEPPLDAASAEMSQLFWYIDSTRAEQDLGWRPRDAVATLADTVDDLRAASRFPPAIGEA